MISAQVFSLLSGMYALWFLHILVVGYECLIYMIRLYLIIRLFFFLQDHINL